MHDKPMDKLRPESNCNKAIEKPGWLLSLSLVLLLFVAAIVLLDVYAVMSRTFDTFIVLSFPVMLIALTTATVLGFMEWRSVKRPTNWLTVVVTCLSLALLIVVVLVIEYFLLKFV